MSKTLKFYMKTMQERFPHLLWLYRTGRLTKSEAMERGGSAREGTRGSSGGKRRIRLSVTHKVFLF